MIFACLLPYMPHYRSVHLGFSKITWKIVKYISTIKVQKYALKLRSANDLSNGFYMMFFFFVVFFFLLIFFMKAYVVDTYLNCIRNKICIHLLKLLHYENTPNQIY